MTVLIVIMRMLEEDLGEAEERLWERERELALLPTSLHPMLKQVTCHSKGKDPPTHHDRP